jgi:lipopolysaccharide assembly outer membrane protein LptD (OstA)
LILYLNILKSALIFGALFLVCNTSYSQDDDVLRLLPGSETLEYDAKTDVHTIVGNVSFEYQSNTMYCDSAKYHEKKKIVRAYGNVHINKRDTLNLYCDSLFYDGNVRKAKLWGNVRMRDNEFKMTTDTLEYDAKKSQAHYHHGGKVESILSQEVLTSKVGYFHPETKNFFFSHDVDYKSNDLTMKTDTLKYLYSQKKTFFYGPTDIESKDSKMYCESGWYNTETGEGSLHANAWISRKTDYISGDTLIYNPDEGSSIGIGHVFYRDSTQNISFKGDYAFTSDSLNYSFLTGHAVAIKELSNDTMYVHADTLYTIQIDSTDVLKAYHGAKIFSTNMQAKADSIVYNPKEEKIKLYDSPIVWSNSAELKGKFIDMTVNDSTIMHVNIYENSSILMEVEPEQYYNQIAGKDIQANFKDNDLYEAFVYGNAMTVFFPEDEEKTDSTFTKKRMGMNRLYSSDLRIDIDSNELTGITYLEQPDGVFYPMDQLKKEEQFIPGFNWMHAHRPKSVEALYEDEDFVEDDDQSEEEGKLEPPFDED